MNLFFRGLSFFLSTTIIFQLPVQGSLADQTKSESVANQQEDHRELFQETQKAFAKVTTGEQLLDQAQIFNEDDRKYFLSFPSIKNFRSEVFVKSSGDSLVVESGVEKSTIKIMDLPRLVFSIDGQEWMMNPFNSAKENVEELNQILGKTKKSVRNDTSSGPGGLLFDVLVTRTYAAVSWLAITAAIGVLVSVNCRYKALKEKAKWESDDGIWSQCIANGFVWPLMALYGMVNFLHGDANAAQKQNPSVKSRKCLEPNRLKLVLSDGTEVVSTKNRTEILRGAKKATVTKNASGKLSATDSNGKAVKLDGLMQNQAQATMAMATGCRSKDREKILDALLPSARAGDSSSSLNGGKSPFEGQK